MPPGVVLLSSMGWRLTLTDIRSYLHAPIALIQLYLLAAVLVVSCFPTEVRKSAREPARVLDVSHADASEFWDPT